MNLIVENTINFLMFLAPGLVAVGIFRSLTSCPPHSAVGQVAQALIFAIIVQAFCEVIVEYFKINANDGDASWTTPYHPFLSFPLAAAFAFVLAVTYGNDSVHKLLRLLRVTRETSFRSEWYSAFYQRRKCYVFLHLIGKRYVYGWPEEWPSKPDKGHFRLSAYTWITKEEVDGKVNFSEPKQGLTTQVSSKESILIPVWEVGIVEFMSALPEDDLRS